MQSNQPTYTRVSDSISHKTGGYSFKKYLILCRKLSKKCGGRVYFCTQGAPSRDYGNGEQMNLVHLTGKETSGVRDLRGMVVCLPSSPLS